MLPLIHSALEYFEKLTFFKNKKIKIPTLNGHISKTRTNLESKPRFSESSFSLLQDCYFSMRSTHVGTWQMTPPPTAPDVPAKDWQGSKG